MLLLSFHSDLVGHVSSGPVLAFEVIGTDVVTQLRTLLGPTDAATAREQAPTSLRAKFGTGQSATQHLSSLVQTKVRFTIVQ